MGTRHLIAAMVDGKYKIAQYGQHDGYISGQGVDVLTFLRNSDLDAFKENVRKCEWMTEADSDDIDAKHGANWSTFYPELSRDAGSKVLEMVAKKPLKLNDQISFAHDSLFCETAYVIDFDKGTFEVFAGFNQEPITEGRFLSKPDVEEYHPVKLIKSYQLDALPDEDQLIADCEPEDDE